jgi:hypothetical protein
MMELAHTTIGRTGLVGEGGLQEGIGVQIVRERADKRLHGRMPGTVEAESEHFGDGLIGRPMIEGDAICRDEDTGAVLAKFTMNKNFLRRRTAEEGEKFRELSGSRIGETANGKRNEVNAERFRLDTLAIAEARKFGAQINDGGDAKFCEFGKIGKMRLGAAKKRIGDLAGVGNSGYGDFLSGERSGRREGRGRLPKWNGGREKRKEENEEERKKRHRELARKSLGGRSEKKKEKEKELSVQRHH